MRAPGWCLTALLTSSLREQACRVVCSPLSRSEERLEGLASLWLCIQLFVDFNRFFLEQLSCQLNNPANPFRVRLPQQNLADTSADTGRDPKANLILDSEAI